MNVLLVHVLHLIHVALKERHWYITRVYNQTYILFMPIPNCIKKSNHREIPHHKNYAQKQ